MHAKITPRSCVWPEVVMTRRVNRVPEGLVAALQADLAEGKARGYTLKQIAAELERSYSWTAEMVRGLQHFPLARLDVWVRITGGCYLARWVAERAGCSLVELEESEAEATAMGAMHESAEALVTISDALADGRLTAEEFRSCERELREAVEAFLALSKALQKRYEAQKAHADPRPRSLAEAERASLGAS